MIRRLLASTAVLALMTAGSFTIAQAQDEPAQTQEPAVVQDQGTTAPEATTEAANSEETLVPEEPTLATAFIGKSVYSSEDPESDNIGDVNDLIVSDDGTITDAIVGVGGFLGIGEKDVAVPFDELQVVEREGEIRLVYAATREQLEAAPEFDRTAYDPGERFAEEQAAMAPAADTTGTMAPAPAPDVAVTEDPAAAPAETTTAESDTMAPADSSTAAGEQDMAAAPAETMSGDAAAPETTAPEQDVAASEAPAADATAPDAAAGTDVATAPAMEGEGFLSFSPDQIRATTLIGKEVFGSEDESIGEVSDLVLQEDGSTRVAIVDVGGFLGVGEKPVAIPFDQIEVQQQEGGDARLTVAMTREQLEQAPAFETATEDMAATDQPATAEGTAEPAPDVAADATQPAEGQDVVAGAATESGAGFETATQDLTAEELIGSSVYGTNDESIGEVGDVVFAETGDIEAVVIDVGGFLGVGEKPVAVEFDALNVQKDTSGTVQLMINASQEQLENAPSYQEEQAAVQ